MIFKHRNVLILSSVVLFGLIIYYIGWYSDKPYERALIALIVISYGFHFIFAYIFKWTMYAPGSFPPTPENHYFRIFGFVLGIVIVAMGLYSFAGEY